MKKISTLIAGLAMYLGMTAAAGAVSITYNHDLASNGNDFVSPHTNSPTPSPSVLNLTTYDFDTTFPTFTVNSNYVITNGLTPNYSSPPFGLSLRDKTDYLSVPGDINTSPKTATIDFGNTYDYLGLWWGSFDPYNTLSFIKGGSIVASYRGDQLPPPSIANGAQTSSTSNQYVNFYGISYDSIEFFSSQYAFEADNISVGNVVPEPGTMALLGFGLLGLAVYGKRRMNKEA